jgi:hypothetical protein
MVTSFRFALRVGLGAVLIAMLSWTLAQGSFQQQITLPNGETAMIDWSAGQLTATGLAVAPSNVETEAQGQVLARRGAILDAQRMLVEVIGGVRLDAETTMINAMANDVVRSSVEGLVQGAIVKEEQWDGQIYTMTLELPLERVNTVVDVPVMRIGIEPQAPSGLVIDARGLDLTPALRIDLYDESGDVVVASLTALYNPALPALAGDAGDDPVEEATSDERVGERPFVVQAVGLRGNGVDLVISSGDAAILLERIGGDPMASPFSVQNTFIIAN